MNKSLSTAASHPAIDEITDKAVNRADNVIEATRRAANGALDTLHDKVESARGPGPVSHAAARVDELARETWERACHATEELRLRAERAGDATTHYVREEPVKSMVFAAAAGATIAVLAALLLRSRH